MHCTMDKRLTRDSSLQKKALENRRKTEHVPVPDLTDFMNDMFFGAVPNDNKKSYYNLTGSSGDNNSKSMEQEDDDFDSSTRSNSSQLTQEWLEEARRMIAISPTRGDSHYPSRLAGSPKFGAQPGRLSVSSKLERRDPLSRSARRHRPVEGFSEEILSKSEKHSRNKSETSESDTLKPSTNMMSPVETVHKWFSNMLKPTTNQTPPSSGPPSPTGDQTAVPAAFPSRQSTTYRKSRFQLVDSPPAHPQGMPVPPRRSFKTQAPLQDSTQLLSPPKNLVESAQRRSVSSSTSSLPANRPLSPPRKLIESAQRRSISKNTCSLEKIASRSNGNGWCKEVDGAQNISLNVFLREQRTKIEMILNGEVHAKAKIVLSDPSNSTSSIVAAICYAWLLENRKQSKGVGDEDGYIVVPVMNVRREKMWKQRQAAWLFHHVGLDATSLLFANEVDLECLIMASQLSMLVVGQDILRTNGEVGSRCSILTDNYCEDAYDLLQTPMLKKLLLAAILLDTQNLNPYAKLSMARDAEAVQLLLVGSAPNYRNDLFDQLMQDQRDSAFFEALRHNYGKPPSDHGGSVKGEPMEHMTLESKSTSGKTSDKGYVQNSDKTSSNGSRNGKINRSPPKSAKSNPSPAKAPPAAPEASRGKKKQFFLAQWFGFGSK